MFAQGRCSFWSCWGSADKEKLAREIALERGVGSGSGDICMFSAVELCHAPTVVGNRASKLLEVQMRPRKCVWIYRYFDHPDYGFGHVRLSSWLPFQANVCLNGRHWLERQLVKEGIGYRKDGNCFPFIEEVGAAQRLLEEQCRSDWAALLSDLLGRACPGLSGVLGDEYPLVHYWSAEETEWATDHMFASAGELDLVYPSLLRYGLLSVDSPALMRFFGSRGAGRAAGELVTDLRRRYEGVRIKHWRHRALNPWRQDDFQTLQFIARGESLLSGFRNRDLRDALEPRAHHASKSDERRASARVGRRIATLRAHGLVKKVGGTHRYILTAKGRKLATAIVTAASADIEQLAKLAA